MTTIERVNQVNTVLSKLPVKFTSQEFKKKAKVLGFDPEEIVFHGQHLSMLKERCVQESRKTWAQIYMPDCTFHKALKHMNSQFTSVEYAAKYKELYPEDERAVKNGDCSEFLSLFAQQISVKTWKKYPDIISIEPFPQEPQHILSNYDDLSLITELKERGYKITREETITKEY